MGVRRPGHPNDPPADLSTIFIEFAEEAEESRAQPVRYILPNAVIRLAKGTNVLRVAAPVSVRRTDEVKQEMEATSGDLPGNSEITIGKPTGLAIVEGRAEFGMTLTCWDVIVPASPKSRNETALWMIDVAISLIRLCFLRESSQSRQSLGQLETKSGGPPFSSRRDERHRHKHQRRLHVYARNL